jgi:hypothetical protein
MPQPKRTDPGRLPRHLRPLFWEYKFAQLTWEADADLIIGRILTEGKWDAIQWLRRRLPNAGLQDWIEQRRGAGLSARQVRFWELVLGLPHRKVNAWLKDPARQLWEGRHRA